jgi:hypothetical protein
VVEEKGGTSEIEENRTRLGMAKDVFSKRNK